MLNRLCRWLLYSCMGWTKVVTVDHPDKYIICLTPHPSNWDFIIGLLYMHAEGMKSNFLMKKEWFEGLMKSGGSQRERMRESLWQMIDEWDAWQPLHKEVRVVAGLDAIEKLKKNHPDVPALIVEGHSSGNRFSKEPPILQYLPNGKLKVIDDCGHMLNMERPEEFNAALEEFLKSAQ